MALIGYKDPTTADESGTNWSGETNVFASDNTYAAITANATDLLQVRGYDFTVPDNAILRGIEVSIEGNGDNATASNRAVDVFITYDGTTNVGTAKALTLNQTTDTVQVLGGASDLWNTTVQDEIDVAAVNGTNFGVRIQKQTTTGTVNLDHVVVRVYYDQGIAGQWDVDYIDKEIRHIDGYLDFDGGAAGTGPVDGDTVRDQTTGTVATVIGVEDWNVLAFGTLKLTDVNQGDGTFGDGNTLVTLESVAFDTESNGGLDEADVGSTLTGATSGRTGVIYRVDSDGVNGTVWGAFSGGGGNWTDGENLQIGGTTYATANGTGSGDLAWSAANNGTLKEQAQGFLDYDAETVSFESSSGSGRIRGGLSGESASISHPLNMCVRGATSNATALLVDDREDPNAPTTGRLYLIDIDGTFQNDETIEALEELDYDAEASDGFQVGDVVSGVTSSASGTVRRLVDNGTSGTLYLSGVTGGPFTNNENLQVSAVTKGVANGTGRVRVGSATVDGTLQTTDIQWLHNHLYTLAQDVFDELVQLDDDYPYTAQVRDQQYQAVSTWNLSQLSTRYLKSGSINQLRAVGAADNDATFTNYQSVGSINESNGVPNAYVQQGANNVLEQFWDAGRFDVLVRNKNKDVLVESGTVTWFIRNWGDLYDNFETSQLAGVAVVPLNTSNDPNNATAYNTVRDTAVYHNIRYIPAETRLDFASGTGTAPSVGDAVWDTTSNAAALVCRSPDSGVSGTDLHVGFQTGTFGNTNTLDLLDYIVFDTQVANQSFSPGDAIDNGAGATATVRLVQQFGASRGIIWVSNVTGSWLNNEPIEIGATQIATTDGALVTAGTWTATMNAAEISDTTVLKDIGQGGEQPYNVVFDLNSATLAQFYEYVKFLTEERAGSTTDPGTILRVDGSTQIQGRLYQKADSTYGAADLVKASPFGTKAGDLFQGARGIFIEDMASGDIQNYELIDANGTTRTPPNLQAIEVTGLNSGTSRVAVFERTGSAVNYAKYSVTTPAGAYNGAGDTVLRVDEAIAGYTPASGTVIVRDDANTEQVLSYTSFVAGAPGEFTLSAALAADLTAGADVYVPFIYETASGTEVSQNVIYSTDVDLLVVVREKGFLPFRQETSLVSTGRSVAAILNADTIVE